MHRSFLLVVVLVAVLALQTPAALADGVGFRAGLNIAKISSDALTSDSVMRPVIGLTGLFDLTESLAIQPELLFSLKGGKGAIPVDFLGQAASGTVKAEYIELPILLRFKPSPLGKALPFVYSGVALGLRAGAEAEANVGAGGLLVGTASVSIKSMTEDYDLGWVVGGGFGVPVGKSILEFDLRYTHGLSNVDKFTVPLNVKNRVWTVAVALRLGSKEDDWP